jgi:predicted dehydrogenase
MTNYIFPDTEVRWGIIGVGDVCEVKSAPSMQKIPHSSITAVMRRDGRKAADYARRHGVPKWYDDADALLSDPDVNAIYIATPPGPHAELTLKAASYGKPVYVEKPMARTYSECLSMIEACRKAGVPLFVAYYRRYLPAYLKIRELVQTGAIGDILKVDIRLHRPANPVVDANLSHNWRVNPGIAGDGYFYDLASHQLDFLDFLFGAAVSAHGYAVNKAGLYESSDLITATVRYPDDILMTGSWCFASPKNDTCDETVITGTRGMIRYPTYSDMHVDWEPADDEAVRFEFDRPEHVQFYLIEAVVNALLTGGSCESTGASAARTNALMESIRNAGMESVN